LRWVSPVSLHRIDPRFALPLLPRTALVLGDLSEWRRGLEGLDIEVACSSDGRTTDLVVAPAGLAPQAAAISAEAIVIEGDAQRTLQRAGYHAQRLLLRPNRERPTLALALEHPEAAGYAIRRWSVVDRRWKSWRMHSARLLAAHGRFPPWVAPIVTIGTRSAARPVFVAKARQLFAPSADAWALTFGQGDALSRNVFHVFERKGSVPAWVIKFARVADYSDPFDRDKQGLRIAEAGGAIQDGRAPRLVGRFEVDGIHASVETAAAGNRLSDVLAATAGRSEKLRLIDLVVAWIIEFGRRTRASSDALARERRRLADEVVPRWTSYGVDAGLVDRVARIGGVAQHNDLGSWNIVVDDERFTVVDWESARRFGLPLWDLIYFLTDAYALLEGVAAPADRPEWTIRLLAGGAAVSDRFFAAMRRAVEALEIPPRAVGSIVTLCWLHHSLSGRLRDAELVARTPGEHSRLHGVEGVAGAWLRHSGLGPEWDAWVGR
jgi:hypothetical protein